MTQTPGSETPDEADASPSQPAAAATPPPPSAPSDASTPPPGYTAPAAATSSGGGGLAISPIALGVCVIGAVLVIVSIFLNWIDIGSGQSISFNGREVPLDFLWDHTTTSEDPSLIVALIPAAVLILAGALKQLRWLAAVGGLLAIVVAVLFLIQADSLLGDAPANIDLGYLDFIGIAPWFALVGGILGVVGALVPRPSPGS
jgi:hypothetical protein